MCGRFKCFLCARAFIVHLSYCFCVRSMLKHYRSRHRQRSPSVTRSRYRDSSSSPENSHGITHSSVKYATSLAAELRKHKKAREKLLLEAKRRKKQQQAEKARRAAEQPVITINDDSKPSSPISIDNEPTSEIPEQTNSKQSNNSLGQVTTSSTDCRPQSPGKQTPVHQPATDQVGQRASPACQSSKPVASPSSMSRPVTQQTATPTTARSRLTNLPMPPGMHEDDVDSDMDKTPNR